MQSLVIGIELSKPYGHGVLFYFNFLTLFNSSAAKITFFFSVACKKMATTSKRGIIRLSVSFTTFIFILESEKIFQC